MCAKKNHLLSSLGKVENPQAVFKAAVPKSDILELPQPITEYNGCCSETEVSEQL
jgi:hypothetical protein